MKRAGFTMIELVFVIVILGILAAVAVPRLSQTKADAQAAAKAADSQTCVKEARLALFNGAIALGDNLAAIKAAVPNCSGATAYANPNLTLSDGSTAPIN